MRTDLIASAFLTSSLATSCLVQHPYAPEQAELQELPDLVTDGDAYRPIRTAHDGHIVGTVGPVEVDHEASSVSAYDDGYYLSVEAVAVLDGHAAMTLLSVSNGAEVFQPGLDATFVLDSYGQQGVQIAQLGCVGQEPGVYDEYDQPADETHVRVQAGETDEDMNVSIASRWFDRDAQSGAVLATFKEARTRFTVSR